MTVDAVRAPERGPSPLVHPSFLLALAVLALNDHVLKWQFGTWWTGKLSDVAGVFLLPLLIVGLARGLPWIRSMATRHPGSADALAIWLTAIGFTLVKTVPAVDRAYEATVGTLRWLARSTPILWGGDAAVWRPIIVTPDPTDLLVLPVLLASWWVLRSTRRSAALLDGGPRRRPSLEWASSRCPRRSSRTSTRPAPDGNDPVVSPRGET